MEEPIRTPFLAVQKDVAGAMDAVEAVADAVEGGDLNGALLELHMGLLKRLSDAQIEARGLAEQLTAAGGVYPLKL